MRRMHDLTIENRAVTAIDGHPTHGLNFEPTAPSGQASWFLNLKPKGTYLIIFTGADPDGVEESDWMFIPRYSDDVEYKSMSNAVTKSSGDISTTPFDSTYYEANIAYVCPISLT